MGMDVINTKSGMIYNVKDVKLRYDEANSAVTVADNIIYSFGGLIGDEHTAYDYHDEWQYFELPQPNNPKSVPSQSKGCMINIGVLCLGLLELVLFIIGIASVIIVIFVFFC